jgi:membrane-anchored protein YejM (alkaline phosphatase superfamily)
MSEPVKRRTLWRWLGWFAMANIPVLGLISLRYLGQVEGGRSVLTWLYLVSNFISHHALLALVPLALIVGPLVVLFPRRRPTMVLAVALLSLMIALLTLDSLLWAQSRFHLNLLTVKILGVQSWAFAGVMLAIGLWFESMLARQVWHWAARKPVRGGRWLTALVAGALLVAQGIHAWADAAYYTPVTAIASQMPMYRGLTAKGLLSNLGLVDIRQSRERKIAQRMSRGMDPAAATTLNYPLNPLHCPGVERLNLVLIVVDGLRADMVNADDMPGIHHLAAGESTWFQQHFSGGNSSRMGHFSLYYGLPPVYFESFAAVQRPPVWLEELQRRGYTPGIFSSTDLYRPAELDRTVFAAVPGLRNATNMPDASSSERVARMNEQWLEWIGTIDPDEPFFGYLLYDSTTLLPLEELIGAYREGTAAQRRMLYGDAMHYNDALIGAVLGDLERRGLRDRTVVVVTADHGEEFEHRDLGRKGHGSGYSREQLQVPMVVSWPGRPARVVERRTSHYDLVPTLMKHFLGCTNPASDYSSGSDLFGDAEWDWLVAGSYYNYAVIEPDQITITFPNGTFEVRDWDYRLVDQPEFRSAVLQAIIHENQRFHR